MAKPKGVYQKTKWRAHFVRLAEYVRRVQSVYDALNREVALLALETNHDESKPFSWNDYPFTKDRFDEIRTQFVKDIRSVVYSGTSEEWRQSNLVQDLLADNALKFYGVKRKGKKARVYYQTNNDALKAFQERKDKGMDLSRKLWNQSANYKEEMEYALSAAIEKGTSAVKLSKRLSKYLNDFPALKKDYKEKYGKAVECQDCEYRSIRLARTEINMAYRSAEQERWKQFDFVLGYEVKLTQSGRHVPDICDDLVGKYPKDFKFVGWHPNCLCYTVPVLKTEEQFFNYEEVPEVTEPPQGFSDWLKDNAERIDKAAERGTLPYWYKDNERYVNAVPKEPWKMTDKARDELIQRGFKASKLISAEKYNSSAMAGFDILKFDKEFESIFDKYSVSLKRKELREYSDRGVSLKYKGETEKGKEVYLERIFRYDREDGKNTPVVDHHLFVLPDELQGKGISKRVFKELFTQYEKAGIQRANIHANIDKGSLVWSKYGALADKEDVERIAELAFNERRISVEENNFIKSYLSKFEKMIPMKRLAYEPFGKRLLLGESWFGYIDLMDNSEMDYLHDYLKMYKK